MNKYLFIENPVKSGRIVSIFGNNTCISMMQDQAGDFHLLTYTRESVLKFLAIWRNANISAVFDCNGVAEPVELVQYLRYRSNRDDF